MKHPRLRPANPSTSTAARFFACLLCAGMPGCGSTSAPATGDLALDLQHADPRIRMQAAKGAAESSRSDLAIQLTENLSDSDPAVRMFASVALRKLTGEDFDYKPHGTVAEREEAIRRWRQWIEARDSRVRAEEKHLGQVSKQ